MEDTSVTVVRNDKLTTEISPAWVDIFPLDGMPDGAVMRKLHGLYLLMRRAFYRYSCFDRAVNVSKKDRPLIERVMIGIGRVFPVQKVFHTDRQLRKLDRALRRYPYAKQKWLVNFMDAYKLREMFPKSVYGSGKWYPFEDTRIFGPEDADTVCRQLYGDYMTPPPENERNSHQSEIRLDIRGADAADGPESASAGGPRERSDE